MVERMVTSTHESSSLCVGAGLLVSAFAGTRDLADTHSLLLSWAASYVIAGQIIPLVKRPALFGLYGLVFLVASVGGPVIGGRRADATRCYGLYH